MFDDVPQFNCVSNRRIEYYARCGCTLCRSVSEKNDRGALRSYPDGIAANVSNVMIIRLIIIIIIIVYFNCRSVAVVILVTDKTPGVTRTFLEKMPPTYEINKYVNNEKYVHLVPSYPRNNSKCIFRMILYHREFDWRNPSALRWPLSPIARNDVCT